MNDYEVGKKAKEAGVIPAYDMISETALYKLRYILGKTNKMKEIRTLFTTPIAGEMVNL